MFQRICQTFFILSATIFFIGCSGNGNSPAYNPDVGPFDENGNYIEAWADNPPKRGSKKRSTQAKSTPKPEPKPKIVSRPKPPAKPVVQTRPVTPTKVASIPKPTPRPIAKPLPKPVVKPAPRPKPVVVKPKPKPKPKPKSIRHVVKKGDTLYGLSKRYGTTISAIQRANGISGTTIQTGKAYVIPQ